VAGAVPNRRYGQGDVDAPSVLGQANGFQVLDPLPPPQPVEDHDLLLLQLGGDDQIALLSKIAVLW
jgi:hypothetical protein